MKNRYDFLYLYDCTDANPNGDPDAGNLPRIDPEIYVKEKAILNNQHGRAYEALELDPKNAKQEERDKTKAWMCQTFFDIRTFGAVMSTEVNCGQVRGPIQISFSRSIDPIVSAEHAVTRMAVATEKEAEKQSGDNRTMGRKFTVPYGLYRAQGFVNPFLASQTGFSDEDLELLFSAFENAFQFDQSAARPAGSMAPRGLIIFKHDSELGSAPSHKLFDLITIKKKEDAEVARSFNDYEVTIDESAIPQGIELIRRI